MPGYLYKSRIIMRSIKRKLGIRNREKRNFDIGLLTFMQMASETFQNKCLIELRSTLDRYDYPAHMVPLEKSQDVARNNKSGMLDMTVCVPFTLWNWHGSVDAMPISGYAAGRYKRPLTTWISHAAQSWTR